MTKILNCRLFKLKENTAEIDILIYPTLAETEVIPFKYWEWQTLKIERDLVKDLKRMDVFILQYSEKEGYKRIENDFLLKKAQEQQEIWDTFKNDLFNQFFNDLSRDDN